MVHSLPLAINKKFRRMDFWVAVYPIDALNPLYFAAAETQQSKS